MNVSDFRLVNFAQNVLKSDTEHWEIKDICISYEDTKKVMVIPSSIQVLTSSALEM